MPYNEKLMKGRSWILGIAVIVIALVGLWKALLH
jgi:hypothetical protein